MAQSYQAEIIYTTEAASGSVNGWLSGAAAVQHTASWSGSHDTFYSVYVMTSGANPPAAVKFADMTVRPTALATLIIPSAATTASVNQIGPGISGSTTANQIGYFNIVTPLKPAVWVDPGAGASWYRIVVVGR
jgi:hypothetical protein